MSFDSETYMEEDGIYGDQDDDFDEMSKEDSGPAKDYFILSASELITEQLQVLGEISTICEFSNPSWSRILLRSEHWDKEKLLTKIFDVSAEVVLKQNGIDVETEKARCSNECQCCFDEITSIVYVPSCGHTFCKPCWQEHIRIKVTEGESKKIRCMGEKCTLLVDESVVISFAPEEIRNKYTKTLIESYVEDNPRIKWCPSIPHCGNCVRVSSLFGFHDIQCKCGHSFCFECLEDQHSPATCEMNKKWKTKCKDDSETANWLKSNTKDCPKCRNAIENNWGCNFVLCTKCGFDFCWICLFLCPQGQSHTPHECNKYITKVNPSQNTEFARDSLNRYLHYYNKWNSHMQSTAFETDTRTRVMNKIMSLRTQSVRTNILTEIEWLEEACEKLFQCRHILRNSYVLAFFLFDKHSGDDALSGFPKFSSNVQRQLLQNLFEDQQSQLEITTETLSGHLQLDRGHQDWNVVFKEIQNFTFLGETRLRALFDVVQSDMLKGISGFIAPYHYWKPSPYHLNIRTPLAPTP